MLIQKMAFVKDVFVNLIFFIKYDTFKGVKKYEF